jgi:DNA-binding transcriptional LysR family regulator
MTDLLAGLSLKQLRSFEIIAKYKSLRAAADFMRLSQPTLTIQLRNLEERVGETLLVRGPRGTELTHQGRVFLKFVSSSLSTLEAGIREINNDRSSQTHLRVGFAPTAGRVLMGDLVMAAAVKDIRVEPCDGLSDDLWSAILDGRLNAAFCFEPKEGKGIKIIRLYRQELAVVGRPDVLKHFVEPITLEMLQQLPLVLSERDTFLRTWIEKNSHLAGLSLKNVIEVPVSFRHEIIMRQRCCAVVPYGLFEDELASCRLVARRLMPELSREVVLALRGSISLKTESFLRGVVGRLVAKHMSRPYLGWRSIAP